MNNKTGKVIWFTFKQVVTSNWFCLISVLGLVYKEKFGSSGVMVG